MHYLIISTFNPRENQSLGIFLFREDCWDGRNQKKTRLRMWLPRVSDSSFSRCLFVHFGNVHYGRRR